jgi:hypothetical protein
VDAVADFRERRARDVEKSQTRATGCVGKTFNDIRRDRECGATQLPSQLEPLERWKTLSMKADAAG